MLNFPGPEKGLIELANPAPRRITPAPRRGFFILFISDVDKRLNSKSFFKLGKIQAFGCNM